MEQMQAQPRKGSQDQGCNMQEMQEAVTRYVDYARQNRVVGECWRAMGVMRAVGR